MNQGALESEACLIKLAARIQKHFEFEGQIQFESSSYADWLFSREMALLNWELFFLQRGNQDREDIFSHTWHSNRNAQFSLFNKELKLNFTRIRSWQRVDFFCKQSRFRRATYLKRFTSSLLTPHGERKSLIANLPRHYFKFHSS